MEDGADVTIPASEDNCYMVFFPMNVHVLRRAQQNLAANAGRHRHQSSHSR
jgi:hypothetical protein